MLEESLKGLQSGINDDAPPVLMRIAWAAGAIAVVLICLSYFFGRRTGRKHSTIVEIRRL